MQRKRAQVKNGRIGAAKTLGTVDLLGWDVICNLFIINVPCFYKINRRIASVMAGLWHSYLGEILGGDLQLLQHT